MSAKDILSREDFKVLLNEVLDERQELIGMPTSTPEHREAHKADALFLRSVRTSYERSARTVGAWLLRAIGIGLLVIAGVGAKKMGAF